MMDTEAFIQWALDDARTVEERFTVELLVEDGMQRWHVLHKTGYFEPHEEKHERDRQRNLNPAYDPRYSELSLRRATEVLAGMKSWWKDLWFQHRPIRDIQALRFLPALEELKINGTQVADITPLTALPCLRHLHFSSAVCHDYRPLALCRELRELALTLVDHWPEVAGLETLDQLETFSLSGNLLVFPPGTAWPSVRRGSIKCSPLAVRSVHDLPCFPACEFLTLAGTERLDGIEKFPRLRNLTLTGSVRDFSPLAALKELTWFSHSGDQPLDVAPLTRLPRLQSASFQTQHVWGIDKEKPRDYSPLADAPALRELCVIGCPPVEMEVAAICAGLPPWDDLFLAPEARPLPPLRMIVAPQMKHPRRPTPHSAPHEPELVDTGIRQCEGAWVKEFVAEAISEALGHKDWGETSANGEARSVFATIESFDVVEKLPEILNAMRGALARLREDWEGAFMIALKAPKIQATPAQIQLEQQFREEQDKADCENRRLEQAEYLERLHLHELKKQEGDPIDPEEFAAPAPLPLPPAPWEETDDDEDEDDGEGGFAVKKKPDPPPSWLDDEHPLADNYRLLGHLTLSEVWFMSHHRDVVIYLMRHEPDAEIPDEKK